VVVAAHAAAAVYVQSFAEAGQRIFQDERPEGVSAIDEILGGNQGSPSPGTSSLPGDTNGDGVVDWNDDGWIEDEPGASDEPPEPDEPLDGSPAPTFDPSVTPPPIGNDPITGTLPAEGPINVLFVGLDSGLGRDHSLSDSLIVASYYRDRDTVTMISIPRDTGQLPLYKGGTYPRRINTFLNYARANPDLFPEGPIAALMREIGYLLGTTIHFYAATNLDGLPRVVDLVGGVDVVLDRPIADPKWNLYLEPGSYHLDGKSVMPYVRSRYGPGNSDFQRARRQQQVIKAVATRAKDPTVAARLPEIIDAMSEVVRTNVPRDQVKVLMRILDKASDASTEHIVLSPLRYARRIPVAETGGRYMIELNIAAVRELSLRVFGPYSRYR
jgi:LCP family protein required for cell wall assembly